jgi:RND family efflux transporter MFP subunit
MRDRAKWMRHVAAALIAGSCFVMASGCGGAPAATQQLPDVLVAPVIQKRITDWDEYSGRFQAVDTVEVRPRASGFIEQVLFQEGQLVQQDEVMFVIDPRPYQADYARAKAGVTLAQTQRELAKLESARLQRLKSSGAVSQEELDERLSTLNQRDANIAAAKATLDSATLLLSFTRVRAPVSGRVSRAEVTRGNLVSGGDSGGTLLTTIVSVDPIYVYFEGDENAYLRYQALARGGERPSSRDAQNPVRIGLSNEEGFPHEGHMDFVDNRLDVRTGTIRARAVLDNKEGLFTPGMYARVQLLGSSEHEAILIEDRAIGTDQTQSFVLVLGRGDMIEYRAVQLGGFIDGLRIVRSGLNAGDVVVVNGLQRVRPGVQVKATHSTMGSPGERAARVAKPG